MTRKINNQRGKVQPEKYLVSDNKPIKKGCSKCGASSLIWVYKNKLSVLEIKKIEKIIKVLKSHKDPYKKKLDLFNLVKKFEVGEIEPSEERRTNILFQGKIYNELAKQTLRDYKKLTAEEFSKAE